MPKNKIFCNLFAGSLSAMPVGSFYDLLFYSAKEKTSSSGHTDCYWSGRRTRG